jgi:two-component system, OmpR family, heavy metal sensor histidine kinase CusS
VTGHSISRRLSLQMALLTMVVLGAVFAASWLSVAMLIKERSRDELDLRTEILVQSIAAAAKSGGEAAVLRKMESIASMRAGTRLELRRADGSLLYADADTPDHRLSAHVGERRFQVETPSLPGSLISAHLVCDFEQDARMGQRWAWILFVATLVGSSIMAAGAWWRARRELRPLQQLARQTQGISADRLDQRLAMPGAAAELQPWIVQFNALMDRLQAAIEQLDAFNADVAHEMRTPIAALMGHIEVALSRERPAGELRETMAVSLEELQQMSALIDDMLFLSHADRGARARRGAPRSLHALATQVLEYHEITFEEAGVSAAVAGDAQAAVDDALIQRALSNLLSNAARYADKGSVVQVRIEPQAGKDSARIVVENHGEPIEPQLLPRLFDRFFRADRARSACQQHHGLGLAIVAAVARMHGGRTLAESSGGVTRIGFELCCECSSATPPAEPALPGSGPRAFSGVTPPRPATAH